MESIIRAFLKNTFEFILHPIRQFFAFLRKVIPGLKWFSNLKPELLAAILTFIFLLALFIAFRLGRRSGDAAIATQLYQWFFFLTLMIAIPVVLYFFLRILFQPPPSPYPDIDESWNAGLKELERHGLDVKQLPIYFVLGMSESKQIRDFVERSGRSFDIEGVTGAGQNMLWYASKQEIYLFLTDIGNFANFSTSSRKLRMSRESEEQQFTETANIGNFYQQPKHQVEELDKQEAEFEDFDQTVRAADMMDADQRNPSRERTTPRAAPKNAPRESVQAKVTKQRKRLNYFCSLLKKIRQPVSPINGLLAVVDVNVLESYAEELARKMRDDLNAISSELGVVCAVTVLISGLQRDAGFINFVERLVQGNGEGIIRSKFGKSYRTWTPANSMQLENIAQLAVEEFDHFVHLIFTKRDALSLENLNGNHSLVLFLCRLYSSVLPRLRILLKNGCLPPKPGNEFPRFAGCYFTGFDEHGSYFLEKVFDRVEENQGELEWTHSSIKTEENWRILSNLGYLTGLFCLAAFIVLLVLDQAETL